MTELCSTEILGCVIIRVYYKHTEGVYQYFIDVNSSSKHQKSWTRKMFDTKDYPDGETLSYCFFIHSKVIKHIQKTLRKKTTNLLKKLQYRKLYDVQEGRCYLCNDEMNVYDITIDHVVPVSLGGKDKMHNKLLAHSICNSEKGNRMPTKNELDLMRDIHAKVSSLEYYKIIK